MRRNLDNEDSRRFWLYVDITAYEVDGWPQWKRVGRTPNRRAKYPVLESVVSCFEILKVLS